jgi:predicted GIY-YIG superfamily endonuclease
MKKYYIYTLSDPITNEIRYIGYSKDPKKRYANHLCISKLKSKKNSWIKSLKNKGLKPIM